MTDLDRIFGPVAKSARCAETMRETVEELVQLAVEIAREGREGRKIGTLFVVGDVDAVLERSQPLLLDPLYGHAQELLDVRRAEFRETVKELAQLDGAFVVSKYGTFISAARYISVENGTPLMPGLGTRSGHRATKAQSNLFPVEDANANPPSQTLEYETADTPAAHPRSGVTTAIS